MPASRGSVQTGGGFWFSSESEICLHPFRYHAGDMDSLAHTHDEYNIVFCLGSCLSYWLRGRVETLAAGDVLVINPGELHSGRYGSEGMLARGLTLHIPGRSLKQILAKMQFPGDLDRNRVLFLEKVRDT